MEVLGRLYINGFEICDDKMESYGWGVYLGPSIMDHSCSPNALVSFHGRLLTVTALEEVEELDDVRISYTDSSSPASVRRERLMEDYFFLCECTKCRHVARGRGKGGGGAAKGEQEKNDKGKKQHRGRR